MAVPDQDSELDGDFCIDWPLLQSSFKPVSTVFIQFL